MRSVLTYKADANNEKVVKRWRTYRVSGGRLAELEIKQKQTPSVTWKQKIKESHKQWFNIALAGKPRNPHRTKAG